MKKLYMVFKIDEVAGKNKFLTVILPQPKDDLAAADVKPVMDAIVAKKFFTPGGVGIDIVATWDAYIRDDDMLIDNGEAVA